MNSTAKDVSPAPQRRVRRLTFHLTVIAFLLLGIAQVTHAQCGPGNGECCVANDTAGCNDTACCEAVCQIDPYCCEVDGEWDACCVNLATQHCLGLPGCQWPPPSHQACGSNAESCCTEHDGVGCSSEPCCNAICLIDPFCCNVQWDAVCASQAMEHCIAACTGAPLPLHAAFSCEGNCGGAAASGCWCDEACCSFGDCCEDKGHFCPGCGYGLGPAKYFGDWCTDDGCGGRSFSGCGCDEGCFERGDCCSTICLDCPDFEFCTPPNPADLTGDGEVSVFDLIELINNWGPCEFDRCSVMEECPGDFNHDGVVDVFDLVFLINNWG